MCSLFCKEIWEECVLSASLLPNLQGHRAMLGVAQLFQPSLHYTTYAS